MSRLTQFAATEALKRRSRVYVILDESAAAVKIGVALDVIGRLNSLQIGNPRPLRPLLSIQGHRERELDLHRAFVHAHIRGEWFRYDLLRDQIDRLAREESAVTYEQFRPQIVRGISIAAPEIGPPSQKTEVPRRRRGPKHPGVVLLKPDPARRHGWRARYVDPDTGKTIKETLDHVFRTVELREEWAVRKARAIATRRLELERGEDSGA